MKFKPLNVQNEFQPVDVSEWDPTAEAYARPLNAIEQIIFHNYMFDFFNENLNFKTRFDAIFEAAKLILVDKSGAPLLTDADRDAVWAASPIPLINILKAGTPTYNADNESDATRK